ncbi:MAG: transaldolase family protein [Heteroscytonema crispum UTEX LB 1556]
MNLLQSLRRRGQSVWLDQFERGWIISGQLQHYIDDDGLRGVLSNFQSLQVAIQGQGYDRDFSTLTRQGTKLATRHYYDYLITRDLQLAADLLKKTHSQTHGRDGYIQVDLAPDTLLQAETAIAEAQRIWRCVGWRNLMLRIPVTQMMLPVIEQLISDRINVNATLVFSQMMYEQVLNAYLQGLEFLIQQGESVSDIACFTSFSIGRLDAAIHPLIASSLETTSFGIAQAKLLYQQYRNVCQSERWRALRKRTNPLRIVWDCTSINPQNPSHYVQSLAAPGTVIVLSPSILKSYAEVSLLPTNLIDNLEGVEQILASLPQLDEIANQLVNEEIAQSLKAFDRLYLTIDHKRIY